MDHDERPEGDGEPPGDYFVTVDPTDLPASSPPRPAGSGRWLAILAVLLVSLGAAIAITAVLLPTEDDDSAVASSRPAGGPVVEDGFKLWATNDDGSPVRWNSCEPLRWVLNSSGAPPGAMADLEAAMTSITDASGLRFDFVGHTDERPHGSRSPYQPNRYGSEQWAPVLVAWSPAGENELPLGQRDRAVAIPLAVGDEAATVFVSGQVVFNSDRMLQPGFGDRAHSLGATAMHELGHLIGLDHVSDPDQLMFAHPHLGPVRWGEGDRRGLAAVGEDAGCVEVPTPRPVDVTYVPDFGDE
ncbi:MAG: matrixin family metalloprotease [Nitriliruptorales bacterium]|nr:matrixin family metalloprotease [Nitriliruptorales bacterium]